MGSTPGCQHLFRLTVAIYLSGFMPFPPSSFIFIPIMCTDRGLLYGPLAASLRLSTDIVIQLVINTMGELMRGNWPSLLTLGEVVRISFGMD